MRSAVIMGSVAIRFKVGSGLTARDKTAAGSPLCPKAGQEKLHTIEDYEDRKTRHG